MSSTADSVYQLLKSSESQFPMPAPYFTVNVGTFNAATGIFSGLTTNVDFDPEPMEHMPGQHILNPAPKYVGTHWVSVVINAKYQRTTTTVPAPIIPLAPVLLKFTVTNANVPWSVTANGVTVNATAAETTLCIGIWDATIASWKIQVGSKSYSDSMHVQRPAGVSSYGVGAFTIPVLPVTIVYAPPADSLNKSAATYGEGQTLGTTVTTSFGTDTSQSSPDGETEYGGLSDFFAGLGALTTALDLIPSTAPAGKILGAVTSAFGKFSGTQTNGISDQTDTQFLVSRTTTGNFTTTASAGGPGSGDLLHFYKNVRMAWSLFNGQFRLFPFDYVDSVFPAGSLLQNLSSLGISAADAQLLLSLDPFVAGGPQADLPADRFVFQETWEYGFGTSIVQGLSVTHDAKLSSTQKSYNTITTDWEAGPIFQLLGFGGKNTTTVTLSTASASDVSKTVSLSANLVSGPHDHFVVNLYYDNLFGTFAFQTGAASPTPRLQGTGAPAGKPVTLTAGGKTYRTVADQHGNYAFSARDIASGAASLNVANQSVKTVMVV